MKPLFTVLPRYDWNSGYFGSFLVEAHGGGSVA